MSTSPPQALTAAVVRLLRPLVRLLLRYGVSYGVFADLAKAVFIEVAAREFALPDRRQTLSRIAVLTGLTRKEVARLQGQGAVADTVAERHYNRAARVVAAWVRDGRYHTAGGAPAPLSLEGAGSFSELVQRYSGDMPPRAVLDELLRVGAVTLDETHRACLGERAYVPRHSADAKLHILGSDVALLIATIDHNLSPGNELRFQRKVAYDNLPAEILPELRQLSRQKAQQLIEEMDHWLAPHDRDLNPTVQGRGRTHAGIGIYYFEEDVPEEKA